MAQEEPEVTMVEQEEGSVSKPIKYAFKDMIKGTYICELRPSATQFVNRVQEFKDRRSLRTMFPKHGC